MRQSSQIVTIHQNATKQVMISLKCVMKYSSPGTFSMITFPTLVFHTIPKAIFPTSVFHAVRQALFPTSVFPRSSPGTFSNISVPRTSQGTFSKINFYAVPQALCPTLGFFTQFTKHFSQHQFSTYFPQALFPSYELEFFKRPMFQPFVHKKVPAKKKVPGSPAARLPHILHPCWRG